MVNELKESTDRQTKSGKQYMTKMRITTKRQKL